MRTEPRRLAGPAILLACLCLASPSIAQADTTVPDCSADPACLNLYERAKAASAAGDLDESLRLYKLAHDVRPDPLLLFSIARILHKQGKTREAVPYYTRFLAAPTEDPAPRRKAEEYLAQIRGQTPTSPEASPDPTPKEPAATTPAPAAESTPVYKKWSYKKFLLSDGAGCWNGGTQEACGLLMTASSRCYEDCLRDAEVSAFAGNCGGAMVVALMV